MTMTQPIRIGIVTISDRASRGVYQDLGGPAIRDCLTEILSCPWEAVARVIPDEQPLIEAVRGQAAASALGEVRLETRALLLRAGQLVKAVRQLDALAVQLEAERATRIGRVQPRERGL